MTRAALTKLLILVILAFIICLPEFFTLYRVSKVNFLCLPYQPCEQVSQVKKGANEKIGDAEIRRKRMCDPPQTPGNELWEYHCTQDNQHNTTNPESDSGRGSEDPEKSWFMCKTDMDMAELHSNMSSSALKVHLEVSVELQLGDTETLNLTLYSHDNDSSLHFHPPEEEEERVKDDEEQKKAFYCCLPVPLNSGSTNQSRCLLWLANQTVWTATAKEKLPWKRPQKDEWRCLFRMLWLVLLCVMMLTIVTAVLGQIYCRRSSCKKPNVHNAGYDVTGQQLNDDENDTEMIIIPKGMTLHSYGSRPRSGLSVIQEVDTQADIETPLDGNASHCYTEEHHRHLLDYSMEQETREENK